MSGEDFVAAEQRARVRETFATTANPPPPASAEEYDKEEGAARALTNGLAARAAQWSRTALSEDSLIRYTCSRNNRPMELVIEPGAFEGKSAEERAAMVLGGMRACAFDE